MTTDKTPARSLGAVMSSETGFEADPTDSPFRISGFISVILALLGGFSIVALPMLALSVAAVLFGVFALRKSESIAVPTGTTAARIGILLAVLLGSWGTARYMFKQRTLGSQAEHCAREFIRVASSGNQIYAKELQKSYVNRYLKTMPLQQRYDEEKRKREAEMAESLETGMPGSYEEEETTIPDLVKYPVDQEWVLFRPVRIYNHYGRQKANVVLAVDRSENAYKLMIDLEYLIHKDTGSGEWHVDTCLPHRERLVADSIL